MSKTSEAITATVAEFQVEDEKFQKGNAAAGTRARKALMELKRLADARRKEISAEKNAE